MNHATVPETEAAVDKSNKPKAGTRIFVFFIIFIFLLSINDKNHPIKFLFLTGWMIDTILHCMSPIRMGRPNRFRFAHIFYYYFSFFVKNFSFIPLEYFLNIFELIKLLIKKKSLLFLIEETFFPYYFVAVPLIALTIRTPNTGPIELKRIQRPRSTYASQCNQLFENEK